VVEAKKDGVTTWITNNGKTTYQLQSGDKLAEACEVDLELLDNEVTVTPTCHNETSCEDYEKLGQTSSKSIGADNSIPIADDSRLWMMSSLPNGNTFSKECIAWQQQ